MNRRHFLSAGAAVALVGAAGYSTRLYGDRAYARRAAELRAPLRPEGGVAEIVRMASLAPNGHNTQSWNFRASGQEIELSADRDRSTPVVDPDDHHIYVSLGAAAENLRLAGLAAGLPGLLEVTATRSLIYRWYAATPVAEPLAEAIPRRASSRSDYDGRPVDPADLAALEAVARMDGVRMVLFTDRTGIGRLGELIVAGNDRQMNDPAFRAELRSWIRFDALSALSSGDGLYSAASGNPEVPDFVGRNIFDLVVTAEAENAKCARQVESSSGFAVFFAEQARRPGWIGVGRAAERFLLEATRRGLSTAFLNQPVEVAELRAELASLAGENGLRPDLVIRFGHGPRLAPSLRRPLGELLTVA